MIPFKFAPHRPCGCLNDLPAFNRAIRLAVKPWFFLRLRNRNTTFCARLFRTEGVDSCVGANISLPEDLEGEALLLYHRLTLLSQDVPGSHMIEHDRGRLVLL